MGGGGRVVMVKSWRVGEGGKVGWSSGRSTQKGGFMNERVCLCKPSSKLEFFEMRSVSITVRRPLSVRPSIMYYFLTCSTTSSPSAGHLFWLFSFEPLYPFLNFTFLYSLVRILFSCIVKRKSKIKRLASTTGFSLGWQGNQLFGTPHTRTHVPKWLEQKKVNLPLQKKLASDWGS